MKRLWFLLFLFMVSYSLFAQEGGAIAAAPQIERLSFLEEAKPLSITEAKAIANNGGFQRLQNNRPNFGRTHSRYWLRIEIEAAINQDAVLQLSNAFLYDVQLFTESDSAALYQTGILHPFAQRPVAFRQFAFPLALQKGKNVFYLLTNRRDEVLRFSVLLYSAKAFEEHRSNDALFFGLIFGIMLFIGVFVLGLYALLREAVHLWYFTYLFFILLFIVADNGFGYQWLWSAAPLVQKYVRSLLALGCHAAQLRFMQLYLEQAAGSRYHRWVNRVVRNAVLEVPLLLLYALAYENNLSIAPALNIAVQILFYSVVVGSLLLVMLSAVEKLRQGNIAAKIYLWAMLPLALQLVVVMAERGSLLSTDVDTAKLFAVAVLLEVITLGCGLLLRYYTLRTEKNNLALQVMQQRQQLVQNVLMAQEAERKRIAEDLHDHLGGTLSVAKGMLSNLSGTLPLPTQANLLQAEAVLAEACNDLRFIAHGLMPTAFRERTLAAALEELVRKANQSSRTDFVFVTDGEPIALEKNVELSFFRIANELVHNVVRHAAATEATVQLLYFPDEVQLMVEDNGRGFVAAETGNGIGLKSLFSRAEYIHATLRYETSPGGTIFICTLPLPA